MGFLGMGIFLFWARTKDPRGWGSGIRDPKKSRVKNPQCLGWEFGIFEAENFLEFCGYFSSPGFFRDGNFSYTVHPPIRGIF